MGFRRHAVGSLCVVDYAKGRVGVVIWTEELEQLFNSALRSAGVPDADIPGVIIAIKELAAPIIGMAAWGCEYKDMLIICPVDNQVAGRWIAKHEADHVMAEALLHILCRLETRDRNELCAPYIHTSRNKLPDLGSGRFEPEAASAIELEQSMHKLDAYLAESHPGLKRVDLTEVAEFYLKGCTVRRPPILHDDAPDSPVRVAASRIAPEPTDSAIGRLSLIEGCAGSGQVSAAASSRGVRHPVAFEWAGAARDVYELRFRDDKPMLLYDVTREDEWAKVPRDVKRSTTSIFGGWPCPAYSGANPDRRGDDDPRAFVWYEVIGIVLGDPDFNFQLGGQLLTLGGENVVSKYEFALQSRERELAATFGYLRSNVIVVGTVVNDAQARVRLIEEYCPWQMMEALGPLALILPKPQQCCMRDLILPPASRPPHCYVDNWGGTWTFVPNRGLQGDGTRPTREGYLYGGGRKHHVWADDVSWTIKASGETPKDSGGAFYLCSETGRVFILDDIDCWTLQGLPADVLALWKATDPTVTSDQVRRVAGNAITAGTAAFIADQLIIERPLKFLGLLDAGLVTSVRSFESGVPQPPAVTEVNATGSSQGTAVNVTSGRAGQGEHPRQGWFAQFVFLLTWFASLTSGAAGAVHHAVLASDAGPAGTLSEYALHEARSICIPRFGEPVEALVRFGMNDDVNLTALAGSAVGCGLPDGIPPPAARASRKQIWTPAFADVIPRIAKHMVLGGLSKSTNKKYKSAWDQYCLFTSRFGEAVGVDIPVFLTGEDPSRDEEHLLHFIAYEGLAHGE